MPSRSRRFGSAFVVDQNRLASLVNEIKQKFEIQNHPYTMRFVVITANETISEFDSLEKTLTMRNSLNNAVNGLSILFKAAKPESTPPEVEVDFIGKSEDGDGVIEVAVKNEDPRWTWETLLTIGREIESIRRYNYQKQIRLILALFCTVSLSVTLFFTQRSVADNPSVKSQNHADTMWLTQEDLDNLGKEFPVVDEKMSSAIMWHQMNNVKSYQNKVKEQIDKSNGKPFYRDRFFLVFIFVLLGIVVSMIVWFKSAPPPAVFAWGDVASWYQQQTNRRNQILYSVVFTFVISGAIFIFQEFLNRWLQ